MIHEKNKQEKIDNFYYHFNNGDCLIAFCF